MNRISSVVVIKKVNEQEGDKPYFTNIDAKKLKFVGNLPEEGDEVYALSKGNGTLLVTVRKDKPVYKLLDYKWVVWGK